MGFLENGNLASGLWSQPLRKKIVVIAIRPISIISTAIFFSNHQLSTSNCHGQGPRLSNGEPFGGFNPTEIVGYHDKKQTSLKPGIRI